MPEYLAPGVYVEETRSLVRSIEGVSTSTTGFAAAFQPIALGICIGFLAPFAVRLIRCRLRLATGRGCTDVEP